MEKSESISDLLDEWSQGIEIKIFNPTVILGNQISSIEFSGNFKYSGIRVLSNGVSKGIEEYKTNVRIVCSNKEQLNPRGTNEALEIGIAKVSGNEISIKLALSPNIFYPSVQLMTCSSGQQVLHLECIGLEQQESFHIWSSNEKQLSICDASIVFLSQ